MLMDRLRQGRLPACLKRGSIILMSLAFIGCQGFSPPEEVAADYGSLLHEEKSGFSTIRVRQNGSFRNLVFVEPDGEEVRQTCVDVTRPERLQAPYTQYFFTSHLLKHPQQRILIVGLGGGAMVHFVQKHFPDTYIEGIEIDPSVVRVARDYFGIREGRNLAIHEEDAFDFIDRSPPARYDAIYMDAFLEPGPDTGREGIPTQLKTFEFLTQVRGMLTPGGVVVFNLVRNADTTKDIQKISRAFGGIYRIDVPDTDNVVIMATDSWKRVPRHALNRVARELDGSTKLEISFHHMLKSLRR